MVDQPDKKGPGVLAENPKRRRNDVVSLETLDVRVSALEEGFHDLRRQTADMATEVRANTRLTEEIHGDTAGIVDFVNRADESWKRWKEKGAKLRTGAYEAGKWLGAVSGGLLGMLALGRFFHLW